jgi:hypothetical protein
MQLNIGTLAEVVWVNVALNFSAGPLQSQGTGFETPVTMTIADGYALSTSIISSTPEEIVLVGLNGTSSTVATARNEVGTSRHVKSFKSKYEIE